MTKKESILFSILAIISLFFSLFIAKAGIEMAILMLVLAFLIYSGVYFITIMALENKPKKKIKMILGMPIYLFIFYFFIFLFTLRLFLFNLSGGSNEEGIENCYLLTFNFFVGSIMGLIAWYFELKKKFL